MCEEEDLSRLDFQLVSLLLLRLLFQILCFLPLFLLLQKKAHQEHLSLTAQVFQEKPFLCHCYMPFPCGVLESGMIDQYGDVRIIAILLAITLAE